MKKVFGILLLLVGLITTSIGVGGIAHTNAKNECLQYQVAEHIGYQNESNDEIIVGIAFVVVGFLFFIIGTVLTAAKTSKQKRIEIELELLKGKTN